MAATQTEAYVPLKLVVNKESNKVIFAEAGKDFVDVLFSFLTFPLGTIARLVQKGSYMEPVTIGCLNKLYQSVADLDKECMTKETIKEMLLQPSYSLDDYCSSLKLNIDDTQPTKYYICRDIHYCYSPYVLSTAKICGGCGIHLDPALIMDRQFCNGFVRDGATFVITDDLKVMPNSMDITSFIMLQNLGIENTSSLKDLTVNVTKEKVLDLLKCSLVSKSALTDSFLGMKPSIERSPTIVCCGIKDANNRQLSMKLVIRKLDGKIQYAEVGEYFVTFLLSFLTFPLGGVARMFKGNCSIGSIDALYGSILDLDEYKYFVTEEAKNRVVDPHLAPQFELGKLILPVRQSRSMFYLHDDDYISCDIKAYFDEITDIKPVCLTRFVQGYVKGPRTYIVTDDLGLSILKASLTSTSALTSAFGHLVTEAQEE
ncbi:uncharacterized protein LOC131614093 [Vicia villosa]|uniref:uncharacterized protein LOC131614093 n=1 Tax=Vicia villosa TaxID=3911 RepID=UPI00273C4A8A|nr:uncharacterized protein LOC131614093 [Vicia villosa]